LPSCKFYFCALGIISHFSLNFSTFYRALCIIRRHICTGEKLPSYKCLFLCVAILMSLFMSVYVCCRDTFLEFYWVVKTEECVSHWRSAGSTLNILTFHLTVFFCSEINPPGVYLLSTKAKVLRSVFVEREND